MYKPFFILDEKWRQIWMTEEEFREYIKISKANDIIKENEQVLKGTNKQYIPYLTKDEKELLKSLQ